MNRILVTNDDGIDSQGLQETVKALSTIATVVVVAPDRNRSAVSRSITLGQTLEVTEENLEGAEIAFSTSGTPTDCVRLAALGLAGDLPDLVVSGTNRGLNLGDDVTYSGTVAAAFEAILNGIPAIAVSQQTRLLELGYPKTGEFDYSGIHGFVPNIASYLLDHRSELLPGLLLNVNIPGVPLEEIQGVEVGVLGRRIYRDKLELEREEGGMRHYSLYGDDPSHHEESGTDIAAIGRRCIAVTPLRFRPIDEATVSDISKWPFASMLTHSSEGGNESS